jgi:hypothetical protein
MKTGIDRRSIFSRPQPTMKRSPTPLCAALLAGAFITFSSACKEKESARPEVIVINMESAVATSMEADLDAAESRRDAALETLKGLQEKFKAQQNSMGLLKDVLAKKEQDIATLAAKAKSEPTFPARK